MIGERVQYVMLGGVFTQDEKWMLVELALLNNKWIQGKDYLKEFSSKGKNSNSIKKMPNRRVFYSNIKAELLKKISNEMIPKPDVIVSRVCKIGEVQAMKLFDERKREMMEMRMIEVNNQGLNDIVDNEDLVTSK